MSDSYRMHDIGRNAPRRHPFYLPVKAAVRLVMPKYHILRETPVSEKPAVYAANHAQALGPVVTATTLDVPFRPWVIADMCRFKTAPAWERFDFFHPKNKTSAALCHILSWLIAPPLIGLFSGIEAIPSYFDKNALYTITKSVETLRANKSVVVFPENRTPFSDYNEDFSSGFVYIAKKFMKLTGEALAFYPTYIANADHTIRIGPPVTYEKGTSVQQIAAKLRDELTRLAQKPACEFC